MIHYTITQGPRAELRDRPPAELADRQQVARIGGVKPVGPVVAQDPNELVVVVNHPRTEEPKPVSTTKGRDLRSPRFQEVIHAAGANPVAPQLVLHPETLRKRLSRRCPANQGFLSAEQLGHLVDGGGGSGHGRSGPSLKSSVALGSGHRQRWT